MVAHPFLVDIEHLSNKGAIIGPYNHEVSNKEAKYTIYIARIHVRQRLKQSIRSKQDNHSIEHDDTFGSIQSFFNCLSSVLPALLTSRLGPFGKICLNLCHPKLMGHFFLRQLSLHTILCVGLLEPMIWFHNDFEGP